MFALSFVEDGKKTMERKHRDGARQKAVLPEADATWREESRGRG
jgi:hypothetical protein